MRLTKHHGLGNDFLIVLDPSGTHPVSDDEVVALCDRHRGIGADGLIRATRAAGGTDLEMVLRNADGSRAEMSGNGISCLVQAALQAGMVSGSTVSVSTDAGIRHVCVVDRAGPRHHRMTVDMGPATVGDEQPEWLDDEVLRAVMVDVGNPHLVLHVDDPDLGPDLEETGLRANRMISGGVNVELITPGSEVGQIVMRVYERGVGVTEACGTGACAAAAAAHAWELAPVVVEVQQAGGPVTVALGETARLTVDVESIATVSWPWP